MLVICLYNSYKYNISLKSLKFKYYVFCSNKLSLNILIWEICFTFSNSKVKIEKKKRRMAYIYLKRPLTFQILSAFLIFSSFFSVSREDSATLSR